MRKIIALSSAALLAVATAAPVAAQNDNSRNLIDDTETSSVVNFNDGNEVKTFAVTIPAGADGDARNGRLTVETQDCCAVKDFWGVRLVKHNGRVMDEAVGNGDGVTFFGPGPQPELWSGAATIPALPRKAVTVEVYWDSADGTPAFPASMWVRATFGGEDIELTPAP